MKIAGGGGGKAPAKKKIPLMKQRKYLAPKAAKPMGPKASKPKKSLPGYKVPSSLTAKPKKPTSYAAYLKAPAYEKKLVSSNQLFKWQKQAEAKVVVTKKPAVKKKPGKKSDYMKGIDAEHAISARNRQIKKVTGIQ